MGCSTSQFARKRSFSDEYCLGAKLGEGSFGQVRLVAKRGVQPEHGLALAVKIIDVRNPAPAHTRRRGVRAIPAHTRNNLKYKEAVHECNVWRKIPQSDYCVALLDAFAARGLVYMVMERCVCSLLDKLEELCQRTEANLVHIFRQMLLAIEHVHRCRVIHRDVKLDNFLCGGPDGRLVKLCDFGLARPLPKRGLLHGIVGTSPYMSPEMLRNHAYGLPTDVWSYGVAAYLICFGNFPYGPQATNGDAMKDAILEGRDPTFMPDGPARQDWSSEYELGTPTNDFIRKLLERHPSKRCTASEALALPYMTASPETKRAMSPAIQMARSRTSEFERPVDSAVQKDLDALLEGLRNGQTVDSGNASQFRIKFFTESSPNLESSRAKENRNAAWQSESDALSAQPSCASDTPACEFPSGRGRCCSSASTSSGGHFQWDSLFWAADSSEDALPPPPPRLPPCSSAMVAPTFCDNYPRVFHLIPEDKGGIHELKGTM